MEGALSVSVVVNNYNYERFVCQAVDSALDQTYADVEVVVVDDGSTDDSLELLRGYGDRITLLHQSNGGQAAALNAGFEAASGDLILFLDADDRLYPEAVSRVVEVYRPGDAKVQFRLDLVDRLGRSAGEVHPASGRVMPSGDVLPVLLRVGRYATSMTSGNAFPRKVLDDILPIPADSFRISADGSGALTTRWVPTGCTWRTTGRCPRWTTRGSGRSSSTTSTATTSSARRPPSGIFPSVSDSATTTRTT
jgi:glycosyltransferase involved in cell wall biosynthesis